MCNSLPKDAEKIKEQGVGWKIFCRNIHDKSLRTWLSSGHVRYLENKDDWIIWNSNIAKISDQGFCFCLKRKEAMKIKDKRAGDVIKKIEYKDGLGKHICKHTLGPNRPIEVALCKAFKIIE